MDTPAIAFLVSLATSSAVGVAFKVWLTSSITHKYNAQLERLRGDIRADAFRSETRFAKLHEERAKAIADTYAALRSLRARVAEYIQDDAFYTELPSADRREVLIAALTEVDQSFSPREIYFPSTTARRIRELVLEWKHLTRTFQVQVEEGGKSNPNWAADWEKTSQRLTGELRVLFEELRDEFRQLLGDDPAPG